MAKRRSNETRFSLGIYWFVRGLNIIRQEHRPVPDLGTFRRLIRPYRRRQWIALYLDRDNLETGGVWGHFTQERAFVAHFDFPGGNDSYACDPRIGRLQNPMIGFRLNNGQVDQ